MDLLQTFILTSACALILPFSIILLVASLIRGTGLAGALAAIGILGGRLGA
jgi:hypothetical protein